MTRLGKAIFTHDFGHVVYAVVMSDRSSKRLSVDIYVVYEDGNISDIITIPRKDFYTKKNCLDFFLDMEGEFGRDDIDKIRMEIFEILNNGDCKESIQGRATLEEIHQSISQFIYDNAIDISENGENEVFIKGNFGYLTTTSLDKFVKENKELGFKRLEILKRLKIMGALHCGKDRPYDTLVSLCGKKRRCYKIELVETVLGDSEEEVEVIGDGD